MSLLRASVIAALALLVAGCALPTRPEPVADAATEIPPVVAGLPDVAAGQFGQTLQIAFADREETLQCGLSIATDGWRSACVSPLGVRLLSIGVGNDGTLTVQRGPGVPEQLDPRRVLADVQLAFWPLAALQSAYQNSEWNLSTPSPDTRRLLHRGRLVAEVHYATEDPWNGRLWLTNFRFGYALAIRTQPSTAPQR